MESLQWMMIGLAAVAAFFVAGSVIWAIFDVLRQGSMNHVTKTLWLLCLFSLPVGGLVAWLYWRPRTGASAERVKITNTIKP
ncbi:PLD nuclease N-terminal domain-containing protein [Paenarthrobacter sp. NPDC089714]|uniref:PLD nuclease N-terminal domain-containing protein n=1 Tax=Paenarthrobacter sp. NPDC089714 TaxID=3364377 RepID=UPI0037F927D6